MDSPTVLCIDDRPQILKHRKATLEFHNYCVKIASSSYTAMKILEQTSVAAVLLEYKLEGMDAEAVAHHIKQRLPNLPIILLSAYSNMPERILWLVDEYVLKSELPDGLVRIIERTLASRSIERCKCNGAERKDQPSCSSTLVSCLQRGSAARFQSLPRRRPEAEILLRALMLCNYFWPSFSPATLSGPGSTIRVRQE